MFVSSFSELIDYIGDPQTCDSIIIGGHVNPDGDCMGSMLALTRALRERDFSVDAVMADETVESGFAFLPGFETLRPASSFTDPPDLFIAVDVSKPERLGAAEPLYRGAGRQIMIDHHPDAGDFAGITYVDADSAAAGIIIWELIGDMGIKRDKDIATCCLTALITDTGSFQYQNTTPRTFRLAAEMAQAGARPDLIAREVYQNKSMASLKLEECMLERMRFASDGRIVYSWITYEEMEQLDATKADTEELIDVLRSLRGIEVALLMKVQPSGIRVSLRAKGDIDVSRVAHEFDGGGHRAAAGCTIVGDLESVQERLVALLEDLM